MLNLILNGKYNCSDSLNNLGTSQNLCSLALDILSGQQFRSKIPGLLPYNTLVAHKTGTTPHNHNDAGIVFKDDIMNLIKGSIANSINGHHKYLFKITISMIPAVFGSNFVSKEGIVEKYHAGSKALITKPTITIVIHHGFPSRA